MSIAVLGYFDRNMPRATSVVNRYKSQWSNKQYLEHRMANNTDMVTDNYREQRVKLTINIIVLFR